MKVLAILLNTIFYLLFGLTLVVMHVFQWLSYNLGGYHAHHRSVRIMNWTLVQLTRILGTTYKFSGRENLPKDQPIIFVSNHQSMFDISPIEWYLSVHHPKFISKIELGKGIPSVSYNLKKGGSALIDRRNPKQALPEIKKLAEYIEKNNHSAVIFPEGTRSKDGKLKPFKDTGLKVLLKYSPSALIVPITINNSWKLLKNGTFPLSLGTAFELKVHQPISPKNKNFDELMDEIRSSIESSIIE